MGRAARGDCAGQRALVEALRDVRRFPHAARAVRVVETHVSWVLLAGRYAYKIKKALNLGFLDYTTLARRRRFCEEEVRLNRRLAPNIYLDVVSIGGSRKAPRFGARPAIEYAVRMRRFPVSRQMDRLLAHGKVEPRHLDALAAMLAAFHRGLPAAPDGTDWGSPARIRGEIRQNFAQLRTLLSAPSDLDAVAQLEAATRAEYAACRKVFSRRRAQGCVRECHGDLHLGNVVLSDGTPVPFDGIEFDPALRWIDVIDEAAFLAMDLMRYQRADLAWCFLNGWLEQTGDYAGLAVLRFYLAYRATVRAKVAAIRAGQGADARASEDCRAYLALANACLSERRPWLAITHGLPGSGKSTFAQVAAMRLGAVRIRSDVERKRLFGLRPLDDSRSAGAGAGIYGVDATRRTYERLRRLARDTLKAGFPVIVDAAFLRREERDCFRALAQECAVPFALVSLQASEAVLRARIAQRRGDASEAGLAVLHALRAVQQPLSQRERRRTVEFGGRMGEADWRRMEARLSGKG